MKIKKIIISAVTILATTVLGFSQKIAHISLDSLVSAMPETKSAKEVAQSYLKDLEKTVMSMETELQTKYNDYLANEATMSELVKKTKQEELQGLQKRIEDFKVQAQQDYQKKYQDLINPILDKAKKAIELVAKEGGYKYVLDTSAGNILYSEPSDDILPLVRKKLDSMPPINVQNTPKKDKPKTSPVTNPKPTGK